MQTRSWFSSCLLFCLGLVAVLGITGLFMAWWGKGELWTTRDRVGVVEVKGLIAESRTTLEKLGRLRDDSHIKAVVLRVNSPGGAVAPSQEIMREVEKIKEQKKVVASQGSLAASGGYYVACAANLIMASPGTATGSIGAIIKLANLEGLIKKLGVDVYSLKAGALKDLGSPFRPMSPEEQAVLQQLLDDIHQQFIRDVARNRNLPPDKVRAIADGRIFTGEEAKRFGLVDEFGNLEDAIQRAGRLGGILGKVEAAYPETKGFSLLRYLLGQEVEESLSQLALPYPEPAFLPTWFR